MKTQPLKILPIGGLGEIGLNCMVLEYLDEIIVIDCGVMFSDLQLLGIDIIIPDMTYLKENHKKIAAYIITHGHEDHIGALPYAIKNHPAPIYTTAFCEKLVKGKLEEAGLSNKVTLHTYQPHQTIQLKEFKITPVPVNHSIVEAMALFIETKLGKIIFTGDFKIDTDPFYGKPMDLEPFRKFSQDGLLLLMSDSTNSEREGHSLSESTIYSKLEHYLEQSLGLTIISVFASNISRIGQIFEIAQKQKKKIALLGRSMEQNINSAFDIGYIQNLHSCLINIDDLENYDRKECIILSTGSQGEYRSGLVRISNNEHKYVKLQENDQVILSSKFIPGNEKAIGKMINSLFQLGADVIYEAVADVHVSGHANAEELEKMIFATKPKFFLPIHGEYRHLVKHKKIATRCGIPSENIIIAVNGNQMELEPQRFEIVQRFEENRIFLESQNNNDISKVLIKDRRKLAESGLMFCVIMRKENTHELWIEPQITSKGLLEAEQAQEIIEKSKKFITRFHTELHNTSRKKLIDWHEEIRVALRRFVHGQVGIKPVVIPIIIDV